MDDKESSRATYDHEKQENLLGLLNRRVFLDQDTIVREKTLEKHENDGSVSVCDKRSGGGWDHDVGEEGMEGSGRSEVGVPRFRRSSAMLSITFRSFSYTGFVKTWSTPASMYSC